MVFLTVVRSAVQHNRQQLHLAIAITSLAATFLLLSLALTTGSLNGVCLGAELGQGSKDWWSGLVVFVPIGVAFSMALVAVVPTGVPKVESTDKVGLLI